MFRSLRSVAGLIASTTTLALVALAVAASPVAAARGDVWTQPAGTPEETGGHSQEVHLNIGDVDIWGDGLDSTSGTWILYHLPPPNPDPPQTVVATGGYTYSGEGSMKIATIPMAHFQLASGPHFKVELTNSSNAKSKTFWVKSAVQIATTPNPATAVVGTTLKDSATLSMGFKPTGTITFTLYNPSGTAAHTEAVTVNGDGTYTTPTGHVADVAGTWHWQAAYGGNGGNDPVTSKLADEPVVIGKASPTIGTTPLPTSGLVGTTLKDVASLDGGYHATGTITFTLYDPANTAQDVETVTVSGDNDYTTPAGFVANTAGTWHWKAAYSGDTNNNGVTSDTADEPVTLTETERVQPTLSTTPNPGTASVGDTLKDTAILAGGNGPGGTITFTLLDPNNVVAHTESVGVDGNGNYSTPNGHVANVPGTWHWQAQYSGDTRNKAVSSEPGSEPVTVTGNENQPVQPAITTVPQPTSSAVGGTLKDKATLSGGHDPTGTITFTLYNPAGTAVHTETVNVSGNGSYTTPTGHAADAQGTWHWKAAYSGDVNNLPVSSRASDEPVAVGPGGGVLAATGTTSSQQALSAGLMALGLLTIFGALALRRRTA